MDANTFPKGGENSPDITSSAPEELPTRNWYVRTLDAVISSAGADQSRVNHPEEPSGSGFSTGAAGALLGARLYDGVGPAMMYLVGGILALAGLIIFATSEYFYHTRKHNQEPLSHHVSS